MSPEGGLKRPLRASPYPKLYAVLLKFNSTTDGLNASLQLYLDVDKKQIEINELYIPELALGISTNFKAAQNSLIG